MTLYKATAFSLLSISVVFILIIGKSIILPIILAVLFWFLIKELRKLIQRVPLIGKKLPRWSLNLISVALFYIILGLIGSMLVSNMENILYKAPAYQENLKTMAWQFEQLSGIDLIDAWRTFAGEFELTDFLRSLINSLSELLGNTFMIGLYLLFILLDEQKIGKKLKQLTQDPEKRKKQHATVAHIDHSISHYISLKTVLSGITALLSYTALLIIGVDSAFFWAFLIFLLNYIPTIGSLIATLFPALMAILQFGDLTHALFVLISVGSIQVIVGNILEPRLMGNSLNINSLTVLVALSVWGAIWGIAGMVLSVPITVISILLLQQFESTKMIAYFLSDE